MTTNVLVLSGPAGVGKSSAAIELSLQLQRDGTPHALIDTDELDRIYPVPADLAAITEANLTAMWGEFARRGVRRLILVGVYLDRPSEQAWVERAVPDSTVALVRLMASEETLRGRIAGRELGSGHADQLKRTAAQLAAMSRDLSGAVTVLRTDGRTVADVAAHVRKEWAQRDAGLSPVRPRADGPR